MFEICIAWLLNAVCSDQELTWENFLIRAVRSDDVSIKITHCGVCYADVAWTRNEHGDSKYPLVPG